MDKTPKYLLEVRNSLESMEISALRNKASKVFGIKIARTDNKSDIVDRIISAMTKSSYAEEADGDVRPGYARIKLLPVTGRVTFPVFLNCNGYEIFIPVNHEVDVPAKVIEVLEHAEEMRKIFDPEFQEYRDSFELSYPYQVIAMGPDGPDPKPGAELARDRKWAPYKAFEKKMGYWPSAKTLQAYTSASTNFNQYAPENNED